MEQDMSGSGATSKYGWPIPVGSDPVDVAAYIADLGNAVDAALDDAAHDTGWQNFNVIAPNFTAGDITPQWRRVGSIVRLSGQVQRSVATPPGGVANGTGIFGALPATARPQNMETQPVSCTTPGARPVLKVYADGTVQIQNDDDDTAIGAGDNININITFFAG
jgi:hypothetical protein